MNGAGLRESLAKLGEMCGVAVASLAVAGHGRDADRAAGARAALEALRAAGCDGAALIGHAEDGRPLWPDGFTGSIAHAGHVAIAAACSSARHAAVGIDIEIKAALAAADAALVLDRDENARVAAADRPDEAATQVWSAKEAAFKAWSTATHGGLGRVDPVDIHVDLVEASGSLVVSANGPLRDAVAAIGALHGAIAAADGYVVTLVADRRAGATGG